MKIEAEDAPTSTEDVAYWEERYKDLREEYVQLLEIYQNLMKKFQVKTKEVDND